MSVLRRSFWRSVETIHHVVYFESGGKERYEAIGLKGQWMGYFASRAIPLGRPGPEVVIATFHGFAPGRVHRAIPAAWELADRDAIMAARFDQGRDVIRPGVEASGVDIAPVAQVLLEALPTLDLAARPLAAGNVGLSVPDDDLGRLWHGATALREYRGDSHLAVLATEGLGGVEANVLMVAAGLTFTHQQAIRGWTDEEWADGRDRLRERGWLDADGAITEAGGAARAAIEDATDRATLAGIPGSTQQSLAEVADDLMAISKAIVASGAEPTHG
ncbi:SCO6745 family protein [Aeromicrobium sp. CF3.5]|uniref:SCO6745 family protein n=1 Tax=Aeromicrobium sp. CF3.5 TaxID=3373078 RepID=UPI003EE79231